MGIIRQLKGLRLLSLVAFLMTSGSFSYAQDVFHPDNVTIGGDLTVGGTGPHAIGGSGGSWIRLNLAGAFTSGGGSSRSIGTQVDGELTGTSGDTDEHIGTWFVNTIATQSESATITTISQVKIDEPGITKGTDTVTNSASLYITGAATEATNNYSLWVDNGTSRFDGDVGISTDLSVGDQLVVSGAGPHAIGGASDAGAMLKIQGTHAGSSGILHGLSTVPAITGIAGSSFYGSYFRAVLTEAASSTHAIVANVFLEAFNFTGAGASTTDLVNLYVGGGAAAAGVTNASSLKISAAPTGATNNYALWVDAGTSRFDGDITVDGNIAAKYQDVAEWVPTSNSIDPGTVVAIDPQEINQVKPVSQAYDTRVAGVVSSRPGILLGEAGEDKVKVSHSGRVKVKVDAQYGPIKAGDLLVSSATPGYAMRSTPVDINGILMHRPGTIIGKALEPLADDQGEILVLVTLQ